MDRKSILLFASFMVLSLALHTGVLNASTDTGEPIIIANPKVAATSLTRDELKNIFLGIKTKWGDGNPITFVILKDKTIHNTFLEKYIDYTPSKFSKYWRGLIFSGKGSCPRTLNDTNEALQFVAETDGAIAYVLSVNENVKPIKIK